MPEKNNSFRREGNQLIHTRLLNAPRELVWEVWTDPKHLKEWWGPDGFTLTNKSMEVKAGKTWDFTMHGMGRDFENRVEYLEVIKPSALSYRHSNPDETISFTVFITFEEAGGKTLLTMRSVFKSAEVLDELNRQVGAIEGGKQTINKLEAYIDAQMALRK